jgi:hypothetical protein
MIDVVSVIALLVLLAWATQTDQEEVAEMDRHTIFCLGLCAHGQLATENDPNEVTDADIQ